MLMFAVPLMLSSILQLLFNAADIVVVGRFAGDNSLAAVGATSSLINLLTNLFLGLSIGANVLAARDFGAKHDDDLSKTVHTAILLGFISGLILTVAGIVAAKEILVIMKTPDEVLDLAVTYLRIYFAGMTAMMLYNFGSALLRAVGDTRRPLYYLTGAGVVNLLLNLLFVIVFKMDVAGVALATVISQCISAFCVIRCLMKEDSAIRLVIGKLRIHKNKFIQIVRVGLPAGFQGVLFSLSNVVIQSSVNIFGPTIVAGNSAASNIEGFTYVAMNACHQATLSFTSQNMGAGKYRRITKILLCGMLCVVCTGVLVGWSVYFLGRPLLSIYSTSASVIDAGMVRLAIMATTHFLCGMMDVMVGSLRGMGYSIVPMIVSLVGACGFRLVWIATVFQMEQYHTIEVVYWSYPLSWLATLLMHIVCFLVCYFTKLRKLSIKYPETDAS